MEITEVIFRFFAYAFNVVWMAVFFPPIIIPYILTIIMASKLYSYKRRWILLSLLPVIVIKGGWYFSMFFTHTTNRSLLEDVVDYLILFCALVFQSGMLTLLVVVIKNKFKRTRKD